MVERLLTIPEGFWETLGEMAPYLLFGFAVAGVLSVVVSAEAVQRHLGGRGIWPVVKASLVGIPLPLCSCGVIPVGASLRRHGASRGATVAFLISTPQDGVDSIFVTLSLLGPTFAIFRPLVALVSGVLGGSVTAAVDDAGKAESPGGGGAPAKCTDACCSEDAGGKLRRARAYGFGTLPQDIGKSLLIGLLVAALITALVPQHFFAGVLGGGIGAMVLMMLLGIPVYVCATASVPVVAALVIDGGVSPGAGLVFLMTGPATNVATIATVWKVMGKRTAIVYLASVALTALAAGLILDAFLTPQIVKAEHEGMFMLPPAVKYACAALLLGVLGVGAVRSVWGGHRHEHESGDAAHGDHGDQKMATRLVIKGMTCEHCRRAVQQALGECDGADSVEVNLQQGRATVTGSADVSELTKAVEGLGYSVEETDAA